MPPNASRSERDKCLTQMLRILKRKCSDYGIPHSLKEHQFFVRACDKRRRKAERRKMAARQELPTKKPDRQENW